MDFVCKLQQHVIDRRSLAALALPLVEEGFKLQFVEQSHRAEAGPLEVKVKVHVVFLEVVFVIRSIFGLNLRIAARFVFHFFDRFGYCLSNFLG